MKRSGVAVVLIAISLVTWSCNGTDKSQEASTNTDTSPSIALSAQTFRNEMLGPELRKAISEEFHSKTCGIGMVCKRENFYIIAVDFQPQKQNIADEKGFFYLAAIPLIDKDGHPYWKLNMFAINLEDFLKEYGKLNGNQIKADKESDQ
jgi:hypothetical protein